MSPLFLDDGEKVRNFFDHASEFGRVGSHHHPVERLQAERTHNDFVLLGAQIGLRTSLILIIPAILIPSRPYNCCVLAPFRGALERGVCSLSIDTPRKSAIAARSRSCSRAAMVAFTTLCGLCEPIDF